MSFPHHKLRGCVILRAPTITTTNHNTVCFEWIFDHIFYVAQYVIMIIMVLYESYDILFLLCVSSLLWCPPLRTSSLPPLDWPLPSQFGQYELKIEVQPKAHHRAHYETEGSRGAVKAASGGHPIVKVTI